MPPKALNYRPASAVRFVRTSDGGAIGELTSTNSTDGYVAFKVKTNAAERYIVRPHIGIIPPRGAASTTINVKPGQMTQFMDVLREQRGTGRPSTAFLIVEWPLAAEALAAVRSRFEAAQLQLDDLVNATVQPASATVRKSSGNELMSDIWKASESAYKSVMSTSKFTVLLEEEAIPEDGVLNTSASQGAGMGAGSRTPGEEANRSMTEEGGADRSPLFRTMANVSGGSLPGDAGAGGGNPRTAGGSSATDDEAARRMSVRPSPRGAASGSAEGGVGASSSSVLSPSVGAAGSQLSIGQGAPGAASTTPSGSFNKAQVEREVLELRRKIVELERLGLQTMTERQAMAKAIETKEIDLTAALTRVQALEEEVAATRTVSGSVRMRRSGVAAATDKGTKADGADNEEEDDSTLKGNEPGGFPLWQLLLLAVLMFLLGRLSVAWVPGPGIVGS